MTTLHTIAVGYDGSPDAEVAVRWAMEAAVAARSNVAVVHAAGLLEHLNTRFSKDELPQAVLALAGQCGLDTERLFWYVNDGDACSVLLRAGEAPVEADLIVVGSRGQGQHPGLLLGSTSLELVQHSHVPVVVVPLPAPSD
ncbi:MAG: universal stress protein [Acidimicrobiales bacterium]